MLHTGLGSIICTLLLRPIDNASRHRSNEDDRALGFSTGIQVSIGIRSTGGILEFLDHNSASSPGAKEEACQVDIDQVTEPFGVVRFGWHIGPKIISYRSGFVTCGERTYSATPAEQRRTSRPPSSSLICVKLRIMPQSGRSGMNKQ